MEFFLLDTTIKTTFVWEIHPKDGHNQGLFFPNSVHFCRFPKKGKTGLHQYPLYPSCAPVSDAEYTSISLNIPKYRRKCLNKLF